MAIDLRQKRGLGKAGHWLASVGLMAALAGCATHAPSARSLASRVDIWMTTSDHAKALAQEPGAQFSGTQSPLPLDIAVDPGRRYQEIVGFGASITDASAWLIAHRMNEAQRSALLQELFGRDPGIGLSFTRLTIGSSDFSRFHYSLDDVPPGQTDRELKRFSIAPNREDVVPVTRSALAINPNLKVMASPWSAPAWMKSTDSLIKGTLKDEELDSFARYLVAYVDAYAAEGVPIHALTVQNEPAYEPSDYPGMRLEAKQRARLIGDHLGPMLKARGSRTAIFDWDHNWDKPEQPLGVLADPTANPFVAAVAWHCYGGDVSAQSQVHDAYPDKDAFLTECSGGDWEPVRSGGLTLLARELVIGTTRNWARGVLLWNLALDENAGPHAGGCYNCRGVVTIDSRSGAVIRNDEYYALAHASRFVRQGARRLASSESRDGVDNVAFRNDDGSIVLLVTNSAADAREFSVSQGTASFRYTLPGKSVATFVWQGESAR